MADFDGIRQMPYSLEAEQALLGCILIDNEQMNEIAQFIKSSDFYLEQHIQIFSIMQEMFLKNKSIDFITLLGMLEQNGTFNSQDGAKYIKLLADVVPSIGNVREYADIVKDNSLLRELIDASKEIADSAFSMKGDVKTLIDAAEQRIFSIAQNKYQGDFVHIRDVIVENYEMIQRMAENPEGLAGTKTGFGALDKTLVGMGEGDLVLIGARPGMGKTSFALNIAENVAKNTKKTIAVFSLEMSSTQLVSRMLSSATMIDNYKMRTGELSPEDWTAFAKAASSLSECDILIDDTSGMTVTAMKAKLRRVKNLGLVIIDYLQLMQSDKRNDNRVQEISEISRGLKLLAKDLRVPVITCAQLSRATENRQGRKPMLSDLRDSGAIEQDADIVMFLYRDDYYDENTENQNIAELHIAKNRHGSTGKVTLGWYGQYFKFIDATEKYDDSPQNQK